MTLIERLTLAQKPDPEAVLNSIINAMHNCSTARMHLIAVEPYTKVALLVNDLENIFASLRVIYQQLAKEQPNVSG